MSDAPERIWARPAVLNGWRDPMTTTSGPMPEGTEYVRADLCAAQPAEAGRVSVKPRFTVGEKVTVSTACEYFRDWDGMELIVVEVRLKPDGVTHTYTTAERVSKWGNWECPTDGWDETDLAALTPAPAANGDENEETAPVHRVLPYLGDVILMFDDSGLVDQARALLSINAAGAAVPPVPNLAVDIIQRFLAIHAALASRAAPPDAPVKGEVTVEVERAALSGERQEGEG